MADAPRGDARGGARGGFGSRGDRGGDRGRGRGRRGPRRGANKSEEKEWQPVTKLGRLVKAGKIKSMEEIYLHSLPIKEYQIVDWFLPKLKDEVMKVCISGDQQYGHSALTNASNTYRSNRCRNRPVQVNELDSKPLSSSETPKAMLGWGSRRPRKSRRPSELQSSSPSSPFYPSGEATGARLWVNRIRCPAKRAGSAVALRLGYVVSSKLPHIYRCRV